LHEEVIRIAVIPFTAPKIHCIFGMSSVNQYMIKLVFHFSMWSSPVPLTNVLIWK